MSCNNDAKYFDTQRTQLQTNTQELHMIHILFILFKKMCAGDDIPAVLLLLT